MYKIGEIIHNGKDIVLNQGRETAEIVVSNLGDRAIQVGSHYHFFEVNKALKFDREKAFGKHLDIPAGTAVRFEPGEEKEVSFSITEEILKFHDMNMNYTAEKGSFTVFIGSDSDTNNQKKFELI